jgi:hypothetical protein
MVRSIFLSFLDEEPERWAEGLEQVVLRFAIVLVGWVSLDTFSALIRAPDRDVLVILPIPTRWVLVAALRRVARAKAALIPAMALWLAPVAMAGAPGLWAAAVWILTGAWVLAWVLSSAVHLGAVRVSTDERFAPLLDLVRGNTPRSQAAFIYAPGVALVLCGWVVAGSASALQSWDDAPVRATLSTVLPFVLAGGVATTLPTAAANAWFRASAVLADIDARYAALATPEEGRRVYLDWSVRWLPEPVRVYALNDLRHGWRAQRGWLTGAWLVGVAALAAGWSADPTAPGRSAVVAILGAFVCAAVSVSMDAAEPSFLRRWLPAEPVRRGAARAAVLMMWLQPAIAPAVVAAALRHGAEAAALVGFATEVAAMGAAGLALACGRLEQRGLAVYGPVAAVLAAALSVGIGGAW